MASPILLEISVETPEAALAVERGGAQRIELCAELRVDGLTPGEELMRRVRESVWVAIFAMIRPRAGDFVYSAQELAHMHRDIAAAKRWGMDGVVLGVLTKGRQVDVERTRELVKVAHKYSEAARIAVRHVRRDGMDVLKKLEKEHQISEDDHKRMDLEVQKTTDGMIAEPFLSASCVI